jgi:hypothetical protein
LVTSTTGDTRDKNGSPTTSRTRRQRPSNSWNTRDSRDATNSRHASIRRDDEVYIKGYTVCNTKDNDLAIVMTQEGSTLVNISVEYRNIRVQGC